MDDIHKYNVDIAPCQYTWLDSDNNVIKHDTIEPSINMLFEADQYFEIYYSSYFYITFRVVWSKILDLMKVFHMVKIHIARDSSAVQTVIQNSRKINKFKIKKNIIRKTKRLFKQLIKGIDFSKIPFK